VFVPDKAFPAWSNRSNFKGAPTWIGYGLTYKNLINLVRLAGDEHFSIFSLFVSDEEKMFSNLMMLILQTFLFVTNKELELAWLVSS